MLGLRIRIGFCISFLIFEMIKAICISIVLRLKPPRLFIFCLDTKNETKKIKAVTPKPKFIPENLNPKNSPLNSHIDSN